MADTRRVLKEGFLKKRSRDSLIKKWQRRYFKLYANELVYCLSPTEPAVRRSLRLGHDSDVQETNDQGYALCFVVKASPTDVNLYLQAENEEEKMAWVTAIFETFRPLENVAPATSPRAAEPASSRPKLPPDRVLLHLTIQAARNLVAADMNGKSDPYVIVRLRSKTGETIRSEEVKTNYITATLAPTWNATFVIGNAVDLQTVDAIVFEVWDHDHIGRDESLGVVCVPLSIFQLSPASTSHTEVIDTWFRIEQTPEKTQQTTAAVATAAASSVVSEREMLKDHGELHLIMSITGPNLVSFVQRLHVAVAPQRQIGNDDVEHSDNRLELTILSARNLISADFNNSSDPFCECTLLDAQNKPIRSETYKTAVQHTTRNPTWENAHTVFGMVSRIDDAVRLRVRVLDWDKTSKNDPLGVVEIDLSAIASDNAPVWYPLQPELGMAIRENLGELQLQLALFGERRGERSRRLSIDHAVTEKTHEQSEEQLELEHAQYDLHDAACKLDGARIACAVNDYRARDPRFYGINGCIHALHAEIPRAHQQSTSSDESFQARAGIEGHALLEVSVVEVAVAATDSAGRSDVLAAFNPYAVIEVAPAACVEECKRTSAPLSPQKSRRTEAFTTAASESRNAMLSRRANAEVSSTRTKLTKNEVRSERALELHADRPVLKVSVLSGHGLAGVDRGGYSDPYCTLTVTDRRTGKPVEVEKKKTAILPRTLNPVWTDEVFLFGNNHALTEAGMLLIHVKDHNTVGRSTPLGRVQIPLPDLCRASADATSIASTAMEKRYPLTPEPWMKKHAHDLGELCLRTEVIGDATMLAEMLQRNGNTTQAASSDKMMSVLSFSSLTSDHPYVQDSSELNMTTLGAAGDRRHASTASSRALEDEVTEVLEHTKEIRTATAIGSAAKWRKEKFELLLSYPGMFSDATTATAVDRIEHYTLHLRVHGARNLLGALDTGAGFAAGAGAAATTHRLASNVDATNAYFTVVPVLKGNELAHAEKQQSLTVYGTRHPRWPDHEFVFGKASDMARIAYLSLHVYSRNLQDSSDVSSTKPLAQLLAPHERRQEATLQRHQLHKLAASGEVVDNGLGVLAFDQRVLAFRACERGGRYVPARVRRFEPFPTDAYTVLFESRIETIDALRDLFSIDLLGEIKALRSDGNADVVLLDPAHSPPHDAATSSAMDAYASNVPMALLTPVPSFDDATQRTLSRPLSPTESETLRWQPLLHALSSLKLEVLSISNAPKTAVRPACIVTLSGNPRVSTACADKTVAVAHDGRMVALKRLVAVDWDVDQPFTAAIAHCSTSANVDDLHLLANTVIAFGALAGLEATGDDGESLTTTESQQDAMDDSADALAHVASILIRIVDQGNDDVPSATRHPTIGIAKIDLASLRHGEQLLHIRLLPPASDPYYKFVGYANVQITTIHETSVSTAVVAPTKDAVQSSLLASDGAVVCGMVEWFARRAATLPHAGSLTHAPRVQSRLERRDVLRASLTPTENAQVDALDAVLTIVLERVVCILREIAQFEAFEALAPDATHEFRYVHVTNADPNSEWIGRRIHAMPVETRKDIVFHLEVELLVIAGSNVKPVQPSLHHTRDEWVALRTERQRALRDVSGFFVQDRSAVAGALQYANCFTGDGMLSWFMRTPDVLWRDEWTKYCPDPAVRTANVLRWSDPKLEHDPDAMQPPRTRNDALVWLSALCDAGYIERIASAAPTDANRSYCVVEDKPNAFYRLRGVDRWLQKQSRAKSLFPLDLVQEIDCYDESAVAAADASATVVTDAASPVSATKTAKNAAKAAATATDAAPPSPTKTATSTVTSTVSGLAAKVAATATTLATAAAATATGLATKTAATVVGTDAGTETKAAASAATASGATTDAKAAAVSELPATNHHPIFAKKLTDHVSGFLGTQNKISSVLLSPERKPTDLLAPVLDKTTAMLDDDVLWDWKFALFVPAARTLYVYTCATASLPVVIVDMSSAACCVAYSSLTAHTTQHRGAWFEIANAAIFVHDATAAAATAGTTTPTYVPISDDARAAMLTPRHRTADSSSSSTTTATADVLEFKSNATHQWVQAFAHAGVRTSLHVGQRVVLKRLNAAVLHAKCIAFETAFAPEDLEGSFQRLLNRFFAHDVSAAAQHDQLEHKLRALRTKLRSELKKVGVINDTVLAYFGHGKRLDPKPNRPENFTRSALYSGRIVNIRTPYSDATYPIKSLYDRTSRTDVPDAMATLLQTYDVHDKAAWLRLPTALRDVFLLYDVEYRHANERITDVGMMRAHFRAADGDLDAHKVQDACVDANLLFKRMDLEDCVTRLAINSHGRKSLGSLRIPVKTVSPHRVLDAWYPLAPDSDMVQKRQLGQLRVQLRLQQISQHVRSKRVPALLEELKDATATSAIVKRSVLTPLNNASPLKTIKGAMTPLLRRTAALPSGSGSGSGGVTSYSERTFVKVTILEARKLLPGDFRQRCPFVKLVLVTDGRTDREEPTLMKADVKPKTLNPQWTNNEFLLGKSETRQTQLSDKRALLLRVLDENLMLGDAPLGFVRIEFRRDKRNAITDLVLVSADAHGYATTQALQLDATHRVEVDAMLLGDERMRQDKLAKARDNDPHIDGRLGKLRFALQLVPNEHFVDTSDVASTSPSKAGALVTATGSAHRRDDTPFAVELTFKRVVPIEAAAVAQALKVATTASGATAATAATATAAAVAAGAAVAAAKALDWKQFTCVFTPHGDAGQRVVVDAPSEDLAVGNRLRVSDLMQTTPTRRLLLGKTYDVATVAYFSVEVACEALGRVFYGTFGKNNSTMLERPDVHSHFPDEEIVLIDKSNKLVELHLTVDVSLVGLHRAERTKRVLAETFRVVGMPSDASTMRQQLTGAGSTATDTDSITASDGAGANASSVQRFLWDVFQTSSFPDRNVARELLTQIHRMRNATKLHWQYTPQLLGFVYDHVFLSGDRDVLEFTDAAALDAVLSRWAALLVHVSEAKNQLIGHLHGRETPQLVQTLFTTCDWTGFEFASLGVASENNSSSASGERLSVETLQEIVFRVGDRVHASVPLCKHAGVAVDLRLSTGAFVAGTIVRECGDDSFDVACCTAAKVCDARSDDSRTDKDELLALELDQTVFVCPLVKAKITDKHHHAMVPCRVGKVVQIDTIEHAKTPYYVEYDDKHDPLNEWLARVDLDALFHRVLGANVHRPLARDDFVRVLPDVAASTATSATRPAKVLKDLGNAQYSVEVLDGYAPPTDLHVPRNRLEPLNERALYDATIAHVYRFAVAPSAPLVVHYDVQLANGAIVEGVKREHLRQRNAVFVTDRLVLGTVFAQDLAVQNSGSGSSADDMTLQLHNLWENDHVLKTYLHLPFPVASIELRHSVSNQLLQTQLHERNDATPRFIDQCHGYIKGASLQTDAPRLAQLHAAAAAQRRHTNSNSSSTDDEPFELHNCVCVLLAPQPRVEVHGCLRLSASPESLGLFKSVLNLALHSPAACSALLQRPLRSAASARLPLDRNERVLQLDDLQIYFDKKCTTNVVVNALSATCDGDVVVDERTATHKRESVSLKHVHVLVRFAIAVPHRNHGSLANAIASAHQDALLVLDVLTTSNALFLADVSASDSIASAVSTGTGDWRLDTRSDADSAAAKARKLTIDLLNRRGERNSKPTISTELMPLEDVRLSIKDVHSGIYEVQLSAAQLVAEATLRRELAPFRTATVLDGPVFLPADHAKQQQVRKVTSQAGSTTHTEASVVPPYYHVSFMDAKTKKSIGTAFVAQPDIRYDVLRVDVRQVSQMVTSDAEATTATSSSASTITAEVLLVSSDIAAMDQQDLTGDEALRPPQGGVLTPNGEICVDMAGATYPKQSSVMLTRDCNLCAWTKTTTARSSSKDKDKDASNVLEFGHPGVDLSRVRAVVIRLVVDDNRRRGTKVIGTVTIPLTDVAVVERWTQQTHAQHVERLGATASGDAQGLEEAPRICSVERDENGRKVVVGKITLSITRRQRVCARDTVLVKHTADPWAIDPYELLVATLAQHRDMLTRGLLAAGVHVHKSGRTRLTDAFEQELQLQKIANVLAITRAMKRIYATKAARDSSDTSANATLPRLEIKHNPQLKSPRALETLKHALAQTKWVIEDTAAALGIKATSRRTPWSADARAKRNSSTDSKSSHSNNVVVVATIATAALRLRRAILKLDHMYRFRLAPTLQQLYALDAQGDALDIAAGEQLLHSFEDEVESLDDEDQRVYQRVHTRLRLLKIAQVLDAILCTTLRVHVRNQSSAGDTRDDVVGLAQIPLIDLMDQTEHFHAYTLTKPHPNRHANALRVENLIDLGLQATPVTTANRLGVTKQGKVFLRLRFTYSESALLEQAISVYKFLKAKYILQHETARQRINAAVVPAQLKRWTRLQSYLEELTTQSQTKLHWHRTPLLLSLVWDIFATHTPPTTTSSTPETERHETETANERDEVPGLADKVSKYRDAVVLVHTRWANVQPLLDELLVVQAAPQIHAQRTSYILNEVRRTVDGLDIVLETAWQQVQHKWLTLRAALDELCEMKARNKIHLGRAPQLLKLVLDRCSKGLEPSDAEAVANVQFRWMAITQPDGPLCELRLMEQTGLHWRRTHELVLLLHEQCEGFADVDARALDVVENRWHTCTQWLDDVLSMHHEHKIDCEATPFILMKMHLLEASRHGGSAGNDSRSGGVKPRGRGLSRLSTSVSPSKRDLTGAQASLRSIGKSDSSRTAMSPPLSPLSGQAASSTSVEGAAVAAAMADAVASGEVDAGRLEGLAEWYAVEEVKHELERIPFHRITTDAERSNAAAFMHEGNDSRLLITQQELSFTPANVRAALEDRGVIPSFSSFVVDGDSSSNDQAILSLASTSSQTAAAVSSLPRDLLEEIAELERAVESTTAAATSGDSSSGSQSLQPQVLSNPERFAELYDVIESLGKTDLLWKIPHAVNTNHELDVPTNFAQLLAAMAMRKIPTAEVENLARALMVVLQKDELRAAGVDVPATANFRDVLALMHAHGVRDVSLPSSVETIQVLLQHHRMDRCGEPVYLRGMRIGSQAAVTDSTTAATSNKDALRVSTTSTSAAPTATAASTSSALNTNLGLLDTHIELLRKALLLEALRKRNSLIKTFAAETHVLSEFDLRECVEVDMSGDYRTLIERFQRLLIHESYTQRLASYAALDRCMRALVGARREDIVTKEDIALALDAINRRADGDSTGGGARQYRLPLAAFTRDELLDAARNHKIRTPTDAMLRQCPHARNARAMAHYAAVSYAAMVYQEVTSFRARFDATTNRFHDALPIDATSSVDGVVIPKDRSRHTLKAYITDWLLGSEDTAMRIERQLGAYHRQRLVWASAAFTLRSRWYQRGYGWCDSDASTMGVGVKVLLDKLLIFEAANKMHMVETAALLRDVNNKCTNLRTRDKAAMATLEQRFARNTEMLESLVAIAERCMNDRKLHTETTPAMLYSIEQVCVVPAGLSARHREAYHVVTSHWLPHRARLDELVQMHKEGTFSIHRTPELLSAMEFHTEGLAGANALDDASVYTMTTERGGETGGSVDGGDLTGDEQATRARKIDEIRRGQRKTPSSLHLDLSGSDVSATQNAAAAGATTQDWKSLSPSKRHVQPLSPRDKQTSWKVVTSAAATSSSSAKQSVVLETKPAVGSASSSPRRKTSLGEDFKELLKSPTKWIFDTTETTERIRPELFYPQAVALDASSVQSTAATASPSQVPTSTQ